MFSRIERHKSVFIMNVRRTEDAYCVNISAFYKLGRIVRYERNMILVARITRRRIVYVAYRLQLAFPSRAKTRERREMPFHRHMSRPDDTKAYWSIVLHLNSHSI